ncbi:MAG: DUF3352 domain-containing protein, partial [Thermosynechococcaceae cyanobacterium]
MAKWKLIIPALIGGSVAIGGAAAYLYLKGIPSQVGIDPNASAKIVPDEALMASFISGDDQAWSKLKKFGTPEAQKIFSDGFSAFTNNIEASAAAQDIDVEKDILPWVGSVMVALMPAQESEPQPLIVVGIKDKLAALNFANKMKDKGQSSVKEQDYKGIKVLEDTKSKSFLAVLENHLLVANNNKTIELAIDTAKGDPSLASESASEMKDILKDFQNPVAQVYIPNYATFVENVSAASASPIPSQFLDQLNQVKSVVVGVGIEDQGLRMRAIATTNPDASKWTYKPIPGTVISEFPEDTLALISGSGISESWKAGVEQL